LIQIHPKIVNTLMLISLAVIWGSAFSFVKIAVESFSPLTLAASRITLAAATLTAVVYLTGGGLPVRPRIWGLCLAIAVSGAALPFSLIAWSEQHISSSAAAICMALVPLATLLIAHFITVDEKLSRWKFLGIAIGFAGVFLLFGDSGQNSGNTSTLGMLAVLLAVVSYAVSGLLSIRLRNEPRLASSAAIMISATAVIVPLALLFDHPWTLTPSRSAVAAMVVLGLFPTALAMIMLIALVARAGATFMALSNYLVPVVGILFGAVWLDEQVTWHTGAAFLLICLGIYVTGLKSAAKSDLPETA
jgi:drug/metabolite transporter (DMT)-like permease